MPACHSTLVIRHSSAFTLIEMLVVIAILGILAGLAVPALKNLGKSNINISAQRQLLDDLAHARQLAISQRTTVFMVFVPTNFWNATWLSSLTPSQLTAVTNLVDKQLTGYTFISYGALGDQPGQHLWHYLAPWQSLPDGNFISAQKFSESPNQFYTISDLISGKAYNIYGFNINNSIPFPTATSYVPSVPLPYIAFNYQGALTVDGVNASTKDEYIPLAQGTVAYGYDGPTKSLQLSTVAASDITETPAGNSTSISYNIIHIDALTGRAVLEFHKIGP